MGLHQADMEVRKGVRVLQRPNAVLSPRDAQHLPRDADLWAIHQALAAHGAVGRSVRQCEEIANTVTEILSS